MKELLQRLEKLYAAAAFAEAGEWETAREMIPKKKVRTGLTWFEKHFTAAAFAEAGMHDEAVRLVSGEGSIYPSGSDVLEKLGLRGVHLSFGYVRINEIA